MSNSKSGEKSSALAVFWSWKLTYSYFRGIINKKNVLEQLDKLEFDKGMRKYEKGDDNMNPKATHQNDMLIKRTKKRCLLLLGFIVLFAWFGIRLVTAESPKEWKEADITVADVQHVSLKPNRWYLTDTVGNTYSANESHIVMNQIVPQSTYHIVYSPNYDNGIRSITQGDTVIVDYAHSVAVHSERDIWDWLLVFLGMAGSLTIIVCMAMDIRKEIIRG